MGASANQIADPGDASATANSQKRILFLAVDDFAQPYLRLIIDAFHAVVVADPASPVLYLESLDATRFEKADYLDEVRDWYRRKYAGVRFDLIVASGEDAVGFLARDAGEPWPGTPVLYWDVGSISVDTSTMRPAPSGMLLEDYFPAVIGVMKHVLPDTKRIALVYGASAVERVRFGGFADKIRNTGLGLEAIDVVGVPGSRLVQSLNALPEQTAVMLLAPMVDTHGQVVVADRPCVLLETAADRPVFTQGLQDVGCGVVGGLLRDWTKVGRQLGKRALSLLTTPSSAVTTMPVADYTTLLFDDRQLKRWAIDEARLPAGSRVEFREASLWRDHRNEVLAAVLVGILQTAAIAALIVEHRRRRRLELESRQQFVAMAHLDRRAAMGELATSLAHEINQPLNAILQNASAARMILEANEQPAGEVTEILDDILNDDRRAAEIIRRMRGLLRKHELERLPVDLTDLAVETVKLVGPDAVSRDITVETDLADGLSPVLGDRVHLQQVLLNLLLNGMDAVAKGPADRRRVLVRTLQEPGCVGLAVRDSGPGIAREQLSRIFEPFFTTKGEGMGMGLAIARSITEAHGGRIAAQNNVNGGATVSFTVPIIEGTASVSPAGSHAKARSTKGQ
jgi:signal transduction histidine kinase